MRFRNLKKQSKQKRNNKQKAPKLNYANYPDKIKAFITDMFMIYAPILYLITYVIMGGKDEFQASNWAPFLGVSLYALIYSVLVSRFGQTPGKKAYRLQVVDAKTQQKISFFRAFIRFVAFLFSATIIIGLLTPFYSREKRALHDIIAGTIEIKIDDD